MQRFCGWGLVLLMAPLVGCGPASDSANIEAADAADNGGDAKVAANSPEGNTRGNREPVDVKPTVDVSPTPPIPPSPVELPKPPADEELRRHVAQLYSPQIQQLIAETRTITSATRPGKSPVEIRLEVQQKLAEADRLREGAVDYLRGQGPGVFDKLKGAMLDDSADVRRGAAWYLFENVDKHDVQMVAVFVQALQDNDRLVRQLALTGLKSLPPQSLTQFLPQLIALLERGQEDDADRAAVAQLIGRLKSEASPALDVLVRFGREDASSEVRLKCLYAASQIAADDQSVEMFSAALSDPSVEVRKLAAVRLGKLSPSAVVAVGDLAKALKDDDATVRQYAATSLGQLGEEAAGAVDLLIAALDDPAVQVRRETIAALNRIGPSAKRAIPALNKRLEDPDPKTRELAQLTIELLQAIP